MSIRTANTTSTSAPTSHFKTGDRLKVVLAAGVRGIGAPLAPPTPRIPAQPGGLRERERSEASRLLDALDNERDLRSLVLSPESGLPCEALEQLADASEKYNTNQFWHEQCRARGYMHPYFLTPGERQPWSKQGHTWREHFVHWCAYVNATYYGGWTSLMFETARGHLAAVQALLAAGANVNAAGNDGDTALSQASLNGHLAAVQALLAAGANVNAANRHGHTALMKAIQKSHMDVVQALLAAGADVNAAGNDGDTALSQASLNGHLAAVHALLAAGADVNAVKETGQTALTLASQYGDSEYEDADYLGVVEALIDAGANVHAETNTGWTALMLATRQGQTNVVEALRDAGAQDNNYVIN